MEACIGAMYVGKQGSTRWSTGAVRALEHATTEGRNRQPTSLERWACRNWFRRMEKALKQAAFGGFWGVVGTPVEFGAGWLFMVVR